jgi:hypothetical protein
MSYLGNTPQTQAFSPAVDIFSGNGSATVLSLSKPVLSAAQVQVVVNNVPQNPASAFTVGSQTITFTSAPSAGTNNIYVYYVSPITQAIAPSQGTVSTSSLTSTFLLPVVSGGTGVSTSTGSGSVVLGTSPTLTTPIVTTTMGVGSATPSASGSGITFPATQSASSDVNTLDDYEEGTWSPSVGGTSTYTIQLGWYVKIGQLVTITFDMQINVIGTGSGTAISGLPFTNVTSGAQNPGGGIAYWSGLAVAVYYLGTQISGSNITFITSTSAQTGCNNTASIFTSNARVIGTISYRTAT